jgi:hypothetical protein
MGFMDYIAEGSEKLQGFKPINADVAEVKAESMLEDLRPVINGCQEPCKLFVPIAQIEPLFPKNMRNESLLTHSCDFGLDDCWEFFWQAFLQPDTHTTRARKNV